MKKIGILSIITMVLLGTIIVYASSNTISQTNKKPNTVSDRLLDDYFSVNSKGVYRCTDFEMEQCSTGGNCFKNVCKATSILTGADAKSFSILIPNILAKDNKRVYALSYGSSREGQRSDITTINGVDVKSFKCITNQWNQSYCKDRKNLYYVFTLESFGRSTFVSFSLQRMTNINISKVVFSGSEIYYNQQPIINYSILPIVGSIKLCPNINYSGSLSIDPLYRNNPLIMCDNNVMYFFHNSGQQWIAPYSPNGYPMISGSWYRSTLTPKALLQGKFFYEKGKAYSSYGVPISIN